MIIRTMKDLKDFKKQYLKQKRMKLFLSDCIFQNKKDKAGTLSDEQQKKLNSKHHR